MDITNILIAAAIVAVVGLIIGLFLGIASILFHVEVDAREEAVLNALPGNNCGGCGYPGCAGLATAIIEGKAGVSACPVGGDSVTAAISDIMGVKADGQERRVAFVHCVGTTDKTTVDYEYCGNYNCKMLSFVPNGGPKSCNFGCLGYGNCVTVCPFDAIHVVNGVAVVDKEACKACGKCIEECPKNLIEMVSYKQETFVTCSSKDKGPITMKACSVGCIGCGICVRNCPNEAIKVVDFRAIIDYDKCTNCGICVEKCPKNAIVGCNGDKA